jgi:two-component system sensor histidine kinase RegB
MGLGFFIAKTLLERSGAMVSLQNREPPATGAVATVTWRRDTFEARPMTASPAQDRVHEPFSGVANGGRG